MKKLWKEFGLFLRRGNVIDLAVGLMIGSAFTSIVNAVVKGVFTPLISLAVADNGASRLRTVLRPALFDETGNLLKEEIILDWGPDIKVNRYRATLNSRVLLSTLLLSFQ